MRAKSDVAAALAPPEHRTPNTAGDSKVESRINNPRFYSVEEILHDGASMHISAIRPDDRERLVQYFHRLSTDSVYFASLAQSDA